MAESIKELRRICQPRRYDRPQRAISIYITKVLAKSNITANQGTGLDFGIGLAGVILFFVGTNLCFLLGGILLQFFEVFDCVDGEISRYRERQGLKKSQSEKLRSEFLQDMVHPVLHPLIFLGFGFGLFRLFHHQTLLILGFSAALGMSIDTYVNTIREKLLQAPGLEASRAYKEMKENAGKLTRRIPLGNYILELITFLAPIPGVVTLLMLAPILDYLIFPHPPSALLLGSFPLNCKIGVLIFYALVQQLLWLLNARTSMVILKKE